MAPSSPGAARRGGDDGPPARKRKERASSSPSTRARRGKKRAPAGDDDDDDDDGDDDGDDDDDAKIKSQKQKRKNQTNHHRFGAGDESQVASKEEEDNDEDDEKETTREPKISPREWFALLEESASRYREDLERLRCDAECIVDDDQMASKREEEKKKEKKKERNLDEISPYDALDSGCLLFEDMWNVRSRAMEEHLSGTSTTGAAIDSTTTLATPSTARKRLKKMMKYKEKEEASKAFDGIGTFEQLLVQKKSQLADVLDPVCHSSASNSALKEPTASEQLSRLPHSRRFIEIYEKGSTTKERVERLKMIAYVLNLKLPGEVCQKRTSSAIRGFQGQMKEVLMRLLSLAFACARHELRDAVFFLQLDENLVTKEMAKEQNDKAREITFQNAQILTAVMSVMIGLISESNEKTFETWQKLEYTGHVSSEAEASKTTEPHENTMLLDFDCLKRFARILRKKFHARNQTIATPGTTTNKKGESISPIVGAALTAAAAGPEPDDDEEAEGMEYDQAMKGDGTKQQQQATTTKMTTASLLTHYPYLFSGMRLEDSDIIGLCINSMPIVSFAGSRIRTRRWEQNVEDIKVCKAFWEVLKLGNDIVCRLSAMVGDLYSVISPKNLDETFFAIGKEKVANNLSRWHAPDFIEQKEMLFYAESVQMPFTYDQWLLMSHCETKDAFCRKLVAFFMVTQDSSIQTVPQYRKDICRTLCVLKYHKHLVDGMKRDLVDRLYSSTEESGNVKASLLLPLREFPGQYGSHDHQTLYKLTAMLGILNEMARYTIRIYDTEVRENKYGESAEFIVKEANILPLILQLLRDIPSDAIMLQKATGGYRSIALDLELASLFGALCEKEQVRAEVLKYEDGAFLPLVVKRLVDVLSSSTSSTSLANDNTQLDLYEHNMCASPTYLLRKRLTGRGLNYNPRPGAGSSRKKGYITAEIIEKVSVCFANMNGKIKEINDELDKRDFSSILLKLLERKESVVKESVSAAIIAMGEHKKIIGRIELLVKTFAHDHELFLSITERDAYKSMMRSITELVKETPTLPIAIDNVVCRTRMHRWKERIFRESEEHIYDNLKNTEKGMANLKSFDEEYGTGSLVKWFEPSGGGVLTQFQDLQNALDQIVTCCTSDVIKFRNYYDDGDEETKRHLEKTKLYRAVRVYARIFRAKVAVGSLGLPEGNLSLEVSETDPTLHATGKNPSVLELNLVEMIISALADLRLEDASDVMVDEGMVESVKSLIEVLRKINTRVEVLLDFVKDEKEDSRIISVAEVLKEACYCMSLLASKSCHQDRVASAGVIPVLVEIISNFNSKQKENPHDPVAITSSVARRAADAITNLAHENHTIKSTVRNDGGIPPLITLLHCVHDVKVQRAAAAALRTLAFKNPDNKNQIVEEGALKMLLFMVRSEDSSVHKEAVGVIGNLVHSSLPIKKRVLDEGALQPVIGLLSSSCLESQREAALLLGQFAATEPRDYNMTRIVQRGAIAPLVEMLKNPDPGLREMAAFALGRLAQNADNQIGICFGSALSPLLKQLDSNIDDVMVHLRNTNNSAKKLDSELKEDAKRYVQNLQHNAAFALYGLSDNEDNVHVIITEGAVQRFRDATLLLDASITCVQKTLQRLEEKLTLDKSKKCREYLQYLMTTEPKHATKFRIAVAFAHLCNKNDMQEIFLESGGLKILIDVLVNHAWNKTGHKFSEKGVSFSRPGINTTGIRRYFLKSLAFTPSAATNEAIKYPDESGNSDFNKSIVAIREKLANVQNLHGHCLTASSLLPSGATGANVREAIEAISSIVEKTKCDGLGNNAPEDSLDEFIQLDDDANEIEANKYVSEISTQFLPRSNGFVESDLFHECFVVTDGGDKKVRIGDRMPGISSDMKLNAKLKNLDFCDVVFVCAYGRREYRAHRIAFAHASEKFLKLIEAGCLHVDNAKSKKDEKVFGAMVDEEEDPARMMIDDDDDDDDDNDDENENENDKVLCRVKLDCSEMAFEKLLYYLYTGTFTSFLRPRREYLDASAHERVVEIYFEVLNLARRYDLDGLIREVEVSFKSIFTVQNYLRIMYHPGLENSEVITKLGWQFAFEKRNVHKIIELHGMNYYTMMMHDDEEKLTNWLSDRIKNARNFAQGCEVESDEEVEEGEEEGLEELE